MAKHDEKMKIFKIAVCGAGVVGGGVINLLKRQRALFRACKFDFEVKTVRGGACSVPLGKMSPCALLTPALPPCQIPFLRALPSAAVR